MKKIIFIFIGFFLLMTSASLLDNNAVGILNIYPHPIIKKTRINSDVELKKIEVYNLLGNKVLERENEGEVDFSDVPSGYYIIKAYTEKGEIVKRVQKN